MFVDDYRRATRRARAVVDRIFDGADRGCSPGRDGRAGWDHGRVPAWIWIVIVVVALLLIALVIGLVLAVAGGASR